MGEKFILSDPYEEWLQDPDNAFAMRFSELAVLGGPKELIGDEYYSTGPKSLSRAVIEFLKEPGSETRINQWISNGGDINIPDGHGGTLLHLIIREHYAIRMADSFTTHATYTRVMLDWIQTLLRCGANPNQANLDGQTPMMLATEYWPEAAELIATHISD